MPVLTGDKSKTESFSAISVPQFENANGAGKVPRLDGKEEDTALNFPP
jgi:hypothetical protein